MQPNTRYEIFLVSGGQGLNNEGVLAPEPYPLQAVKVTCKNLSCFIHLQRTFLIVHFKNPYTIASKTTNYLGIILTE